MSTPRHDEDFRDPAATLTDIIRLARPRAGDVVVAVVRRGPGGFGHAEDAMTIHRAPTDQPRLPEPRLDDDVAASLVCEAAHRLLAGREDVLDDGDDLRYVLVTVVFRPGSPSPGRAELFWRHAWALADVDVVARLGDVYTVTDHGWTRLLDRRTGQRPALDRDQ